MSLGRALTLVIWSETGDVVAAYQSHWFGVVTIAGRQFEHLPFEGSGIFQGHVSGEGATSVDLPATKANWDLCSRAMASGGRWLAQLELWEFPAAGSESLPPANMVRIGLTRGQIVSASNDPITTIRLELGSSLSPVGAMIPPRTATSRLIGPGMKA
ncbi:MAG: hypothetical protein VKN56_08410 [Cyanobacteriota bacterium]|nr:hypothetical protein [Cyanobacteriota bacterium]